MDNELMDTEWPYDPMAGFRVGVMSRSRPSAVNRLSSFQLVGTRKSGGFRRRILPTPGLDKRQRCLVERHVMIGSM